MQRKGQNPVKLPFRLRTTEKTLAAWTGEVRDCLQQLRDRIPGGPGGRGPNIGGGGGKPPFWAAIVAGEEEGAFAVKVTPGYLKYQNAGSEVALGHVTGYLTPTVGGTSIESTDPVPQLELTGVVAFVYLRVATDSDGIPIEGAVTVEVYEDPQESIHHARPSPAGGEESGEYYYLLAEIESNGAEPEKPRIARRFPGDREMTNQLIEIRNIGGKRELYKKYEKDEDKHEFRTLEQIDARGEEIMKAVAEGEEEGDTIKFKRIAERESQAVIHVVSEGDDLVEIHGNSFDASYGSIRHFNIEIRDGLVEGFAPVDEGGWWGTVMFHCTDVNFSTQTVKFDIQAGSIVSILMGDGEGETPVVGIEDDQGNVILEWFDEVDPPS